MARRRRAGPPSRSTSWFPSRPGSATDIIARTVFEQVGRQVGQPAVIESRLGAGGTTASAAVARADPDGYTVLFTSSAYTITPLIQANLPFDPVRDLAGVTPVANLPNVMVIPDRKSTRLNSR